MSGEAYARNTDPDTSHEAAERVDANYSERIVLLALKSIGQATVKEISRYAGIHEWTISPRMKPLEEKGLVQRCGRRGHCTLWELV